MRILRRHHRRCAAPTFHAKPVAGRCARHAAWRVPLLDYLVATSDSVGAGVKQLARYFSLVGSPLTFAIHEDAKVVRVEFGKAALPFTVEYQAALMVQHLRAETEGRFTAAAVAFQHNPDDLAEFSRALGCPVESGKTWNGMLIAPEAWCFPLRRRDPVLRQVPKGGPTTSWRVCHHGLELRPTSGGH